MNKFYLEDELNYRGFIVTYNVSLKDGKLVADIYSSTKEFYNIYSLPNQDSLIFPDFLKKLDYINSIYFDNEFLVIVTSSLPSITKYIFDLRNIELNDDVISSIKSIEEKISNKNENLISKYIHYICKSIKGINVPLIKNGEINDLKDYYNTVYNTIRDKKKEKRENIESFYSIKRALFYSSIFSIPYIFVHTNVTSLIRFLIEYNAIMFSFCKLGDFLINSYQLDNYIDLCRKVQKGDTKTIEELTETLATEFYRKDIVDSVSVSSQIDNEDSSSLKSSFELGLFRDLTILNSIDSQANAEKILNLLNLGYEYLMYQSNIRDHDIIIEDFFRKRLNDIEKTISFPIEINNDLSYSDLDLINANTVDNGKKKILIPILHK